MDYEPLDISQYCQSGIEFYDPQQYIGGGSYIYPYPENPPIGDQTFHGLPFKIGNSKHNEQRECFIGFEGEGKQDVVKISVGKTAYYILFAHAVLETNLWNGGTLGNVIANYRFHLDDGQIIDVPIRERFEIGNIPLPWGQFPFLCVPDQKHTLRVDRWAGEWQDLGWRHTEVADAVPSGYYIWVWTHPLPECPVKWIEVIPGKQKFVLAAITLGHLPEYPLVRSTKRPVKITLLDEQDTLKSFDLQVEVDRGASTFPYPLPEIPLDQLDPSMSGFGAPLNKRNSPAYAEIAATPSATVKIKSAGEEVARVHWGRLQEEKIIETSRACVEVFEPGKNWVKVQVVDEDSGDTIPCRIAFLSQDGIPYAPHGHHAPLFSNIHTWNNDVGGDVRLGQITYAYINGECEGWLPRGKVLVDVARGFEYEPKRTWVEIEPGQQELRLSLKRWIDMKANRYFSGDTHVHFLSAQGAHTEAAAEDLQVVNLLQSQWGHLFSNTEEFMGHPSISQDGDTIVYVSQENRQHILGHLSLLGLKKPVMPWGSGGPTEAELGGGLDITMSHWADQTHEQGGTVIIPHLPTPNGEPAALVATGRADAVEMLDFLQYEHLEYYRYLNAGYQLPLVGGTDKMSGATPVGLYRSYVYIPPDEEFNYENWCKALRGGRSFVSGGAMIDFFIEGQPIGSHLHIQGGGTVEIEAQAQSIFPLHTLQIVQQGNVVADTNSIKGERKLSLRTTLKIKQDTWLAARCAGPDYTAKSHFDQRHRGIMAHTSPIYIICNEEYTVFDSAAAQYMLTLVEGGLSYIKHQSPQHSPEHTTHHHGLQDHMNYLEAPFHEAAEALHRRMHQFGIPH